MTDDDKATESTWTGPPIGGERDRHLFASQVRSITTATAVEFNDTETVVRYSDQAQPTLASELTTIHERIHGAAAVPHIVLERWEGTPSEHHDDPTTFTGPGFGVARGPAAKLTRQLDGDLRQLAIAQGAEDWVVPALVTEDTLARGGYLAAFPQHVIGCAVPRRELDALERLRHGFEPGVFEVASVALTPAACLHVYAALAGSTLESPAHVTCLAECGRYEHGSTHDPLRRASYKVREVVVIGSAADADSFVGRWLDVLAELGNSTGLPCRLQTADDPFFGPTTARLATYQRRLRTKHELIGTCADGRDVALASVNRHGAHFGNGFEIRYGNDVASSACVGFGIERWVSWIFGHLGDDGYGWPSPLLSRPAVGSRE